MTQKHTPGLTHISVGNFTDYGRGKRAAAGWRLNGARYHVWFDVDTKAIERRTLKSTPTLYKNPLVESDHSDYFDTRYLDATKPGNAAAIREVFAYIEAHGLIAAAIAAKDAEEKKRADESAAYVRAEQVKAAAPELLAALEAIEAGFRDGSIKFTKKRQSDSDQYHPANTLMSKALAKTRGQS